MNRKIILFGSILAVFLILMIPNVSSIECKQVTNNIIDKQEIFENKKDTPPSLPRLYMKIFFHYNDDDEFEITNAQADKTFQIGKRTIYIGNVIIEGKINGNFFTLTYGVVTSFVGTIFAILFGRLVSFLPGCYWVDGEFTIKARYFILEPERSELLGSAYVTAGRGLFVKVY